MTIGIAAQLSLSRSAVSRERPARPAGGKSAAQNLNNPPAYVVYKNMETITGALVMEHAIFREVFDQIERVLADAPSAAEVKLLASVVEGLLARHAEAETNLAYTALDHALADRGALDRLHQDHHEIDHQFKRLRRETDAVEAQHRLKRALAATREHFRREERTVFPMLEQTLQPDTLGLLGRKWMENHSVFATA
jgi:hemerythrin-like domain-containing protein